MTVDPAAAAKARTSRKRAVIACHLHGVCADIPALRSLLPGVGILEDAAQAFGCGLDGRPAGSLGDVAVLSLGPGMQVESGDPRPACAGRMDAAASAQAHTRVRRLLAADARLKPLDEESRHASSHPCVPVLLPPGGRPPGPPAGVRWTHSGAQVLPCVPPGDREAAASLLGRVRLACAITNDPGRSGP